MIIKGTYLIRSIEIEGSTLKIRGDINTTETIEILAGDSVKKVRFNGDDIKVDRSSYGSLLGKLVYKEPKVELPGLGKLTWVRFSSPLSPTSLLSRKLMVRMDRNMRTACRKLVASMMIVNGPTPTRRIQIIQGH